MSPSNGGRATFLRCNDALGDIEEGCCSRCFFDQMHVREVAAFETYGWRWWGKPWWAIAVHGCDDHWPHDVAFRQPAAPTR